MTATPFMTENARSGVRSHAVPGDSMQSVTVMRYEDMSSRLTKALEAVAQLSALPEGWDSDGNSPMRDEAINVARKLLIILDRELPPSPRVIPVIGGGVELAWQKAGRELELFVHPNGSVDYVRFADGVDVDDDNEASLNLSGESELQNLMRWLLGKMDA